MSKEKLKQLKKQIKDMEDPNKRKEIYELSKKPSQRARQVSQLVQRLESSVEAGRLEGLLLNDHT